MNCREAGEMFSPRLDQELSREKEISLQEHLESCPVCRREWSEWQRVAMALHRLKQEEIPAPAEFSAAVMSRIESENVRPARVDWKRWKQAVIGTAAALLLAAGSLTIRTDHFIQVADQNKHINQAQSSQPQAETGNQNSKTSAPSTEANMQQPGSHQTGSSFISQNTQSPSGSVSQSTAPTAQFTSDQKHIIVTTFLKIKVGDAQKSEATAIILAKAGGASIQSLGQQSEGGVVYLADKIVIEGAHAEQLIRNLSSLGASSQTEEEENVTQRYSEMYSQLISLKNQRAQTRDSEQVSGLDRQIGQIEDQLHNWDAQASQRTIVLWLQQ